MPAAARGRWRREAAQPTALLCPACQSFRQKKSLLLSLPFRLQRSDWPSNWWLRARPARSFARATCLRSLAAAECDCPLARHLGLLRLQWHRSSFLCSRVHPCAWKAPRWSRKVLPYRYSRLPSSWPLLLLLVMNITNFSPIKFYYHGVLGFWGFGGLWGSQPFEIRAWLG